MARGEKNKNEKSRTEKNKNTRTKDVRKRKNFERNDDLHCPTPNVKYEVVSFCLIFQMRFEAPMRDFIPKLGDELRLLRVCPREHQAVVLHAISPILTRLGQKATTLVLIPLYNPSFHL